MTMKSEIDRLESRREQGQWLLSHRLHATLLANFTCSTPVCPAGKIEARIALRNSLRKSIEANQRELFEPVFTMPTGSLIFGTNELTGHPNLPHARLENMQRQFVSGTYNVSAPASLTVSRRAIYDESPVPDITELLARADNRIAEVKEQQQQMLDIEVPRDTSLPGTENYPKIVKVRVF